MKPIENESAESNHYVAVVDRVHVRIFQTVSEPGQSHPALRAVEALDLPAGRGKIGDRLSDEAGRFQSGTAAKAGSIDERLPMYREGQKRLCEEIGRHLSEFFRARPQATWDVAIAQPILHQVLDEVEAGPRTRVRRVLPKDLTNEPAERLPAHFARAEPVVA